jgi:tRNA A-37 threonylcarbamoyl transferase component Bud32/tetratricopeptide (TPR) repeat protein
MSDTRDELQTALGDSYRLERELGGGGMSRVYLAEETALGRRVVVKVLSPELMAGVNIDRFRREIQLAARLQQAQIVPVLSAGEMNGVPYYTMPFVDGESLRARLARDGKLPVHDVLNILRDVTRALAYAHEHGVVHRDIKPDNVLLSGGTAVVTDFGIAKAIAAASNQVGTDASTSALTQLGTSVGTPAYISPEQAAGDPNIDHRSDIYSLGCMAYELLTGSAPFAGRSPQRTLVAHLTETPAPISDARTDIPSVLAELVMRCLEKDPAKRPQSAAEIETALNAVTTGAFGSAAPGLFGRPISTRVGIGLYAGAFVAVALLAKAASVVFGLPDWVFSGAVGLMVLGLPAVALAALGTTRHVTWSRTARWGGIALGGFATAVVAIMVLRLFGVGPAASLLAAGRLHGSERLLVVDFNAGKDSSLSHVVTEAVRTNLAQSKVISIVPPTGIAAALQRMQRPTDTPIDVALAREIAVREGMKAIVAGDVTQLGTSYVVSIRLVSADSGKELAAYHESVGDASELLEAIDGLTRKLRGRIGESLKTVRDAPAIGDVTTSSLEALQKYAEAIRASDLRGDYLKSAALLREAVAKDSNFAMAYRKLGVTLSNIGMPRAQIDSALTRAYELRNRLPERERYLTTASYFGTGPGLDRQKAAQAFEQVLALDSLDMTAAVNLANSLRQLREFARADSLYRRINRSTRATQISMSNHASLLMAAGKVAESESLFQETARRFPGSRIGQTYPAIFLYQRGQIDSMEAFWKERASNADPLMKIPALSNLTSIALLRGQLRRARDLGAEVRKASSAVSGTTNPLSDSLVSAGVQIWYLDNHERGVRTLDAALAAFPMKNLPLEQRPYFGVIQFYSLAGRPDKARAILAQLDADVQEPRLRRNVEPSRHAALAEILIAEKRPLDAVRELWASDSMPDGPSNECAHCNDSELARAFDLANQPDSAIFYWERYLAESHTRNPGRDGPYLAGIRKRLGELYEGKGDLARAESHFTAFVDLWKNADPELQPKVAEVRARLAAIRQRKGG